MGGLFRAIAASCADGELFKAIADSRNCGGLWACDGIIAVVESEKIQEGHGTSQEITNGTRKILS